MALDTYSNLQASILSWINRSNDTDAIARCPDWITLAENEFRMALSRLKVRQGETQNATFSIGTEYTALPTDYIGTRAIVLNTSPVQVLDYVTPTVADNWDIYVNASKPRFYTIQNKQLRVYPAPDLTYTAKFTYYTLPSLSVSDPANWLLTAQPKLYLAAALAESYGYYGNSAKLSAKEC